MFVTDTHAFIWFLTGDVKIGKEAKNLFLKADNGEITIVVPSVVLLEALYICERHRVMLKFKKILEKIRNTINYPIYPLDIDVIIECQNLKRLSNLHDRVVVATARLLNAKLITKDQEIKKSKLVDTVW